MDGRVKDDGRGVKPDPFLEHRKAQEREHLKRVETDPDVMASLITVEVNTTELCNRKCVFCPRVDPELYPNRNLNMELSVAEKVASDLLEIGGRCRVSYSGFGEPLLHKKFPDIVRTFRRILPDTVLETNTNGDRLTAEKTRVLFEAGLTYLYVNLYDGPEQRPKFEALFEAAGIDESQYHLREHWRGPDDDFGLNLNNRSGTLNAPEIGVGPLDIALKNRCYYPFYKMFVDWNGDVLFCSNDWGREIIVGNVMKESIRSIWLSEKMFEIRRNLMNGDRCFSPCDKCSVNGTLHGESSFRRLVDHYVEAGRFLKQEAAR